MGTSMPPQPDPLEQLKALKRQAAASASDAPDPLEQLKAMKASGPGVIMRGLTGAAEGTWQALRHPINTAESMAKSTRDAFDTAGGYLGQRAAELTLPPDVRALAEADPTRISGKDAAIAGAQVGAVALPFLGGSLSGALETVLPRTVARAATKFGAGAAAGAAFNPNDPVAGAISGTGMMAAGDAALGGLKRVGGTVMDARGARPMESQTVKAGPVTLGTIEGIRDRATRINSRLVQGAPGAGGLSPFSDKPVTPADVIGTQGVRALRGLKTASPAAESVIRDAFDERSGNAVDRVIQHGLETTGLVNRQSGILTENDLHNLAAEQGKIAYGKTFANAPDPIQDPAALAEMNAILKTDAGQTALKRGMRIANNFRDPIGSIAEKMSAPEGIDPKDWANMQRIAQERGMPLPDALSGARQLAPTLKQAHYIKLGFDDMLDGAPEPGSGGSGPVEAASIRQLKNDWLKVMDNQSQDYQATRGQYANTKQLERGAALGQQLFTLDPDVMKLELAKLPAAAQQIARRTGFDALANRIENGPADVERGIGKARDQRRMQLLFPDAASFDQFRQGLIEEGAMHANEQGVLGGSNTADKLADIANMAGVTLPDLARAAATGRWHRLLGQVAANVTRKMTTQGADATATERARQLTAGANGDLGARNSALERLGLISPQQPPWTARAWAGQQPVVANPDLLASGSGPASGEPSLGGGPIPPSRRVPFTTPTAGDFQQGAAMPVNGPIPTPRRLNGIVRPQVVGGDVQHGTAMAIPQPVPMARRLPSAGPTPIATPGESPLGPAIPTGGQSLEDAVRSAMLGLYQRNPEWAISLSPSGQASLAEEIRKRFTGGR